MIHPATELRWAGPTKGHGVFATTIIPRGTLTYVQDPLDIVLQPDAFDLLAPALQTVADRYAFVGPDGQRIVSWDHAKYVNHSCSPNTISTGWGFEIALRDIAPGEELVDEYALFNMTEILDCACGAPACRGRVEPADALGLYVVWDHAIADALRRLTMVDQPLFHLLDREILEDLMRYLNGQAPYRSVLDLLIPTTDAAARRA